MSKSERDKEREAIAKKTHTKLRKDLFVAHLTNPESDTFCNLTKAAQKAHPNITRQSASTTGHLYLKNRYVKNEIERVIEEAGIGFKDRVRVLRDIFFGDLTRESVTLVKDSDTKSWKEVQKHVSAPSFTERVNAIRVLNQIDGTDKKASQILSNQNRLMAEMRKKLIKDLDVKKDREASLRNVTDQISKEAEKTQPGQSSSELDAFLTGEQGGDADDIIKK